MKPRMAGSGLASNPYLHAAAEALLTAGAIAVPQAMTGEADIDLAYGVLAGLGAAVPGSIIGNKGGRLVGRQVDRYFHSSPERLQSVMNIPKPVYDTYSGAMNVLVPGSRHNVRAIDQMMANPQVAQEIKDQMAPLAGIAKARGEAFNRRPDGSYLHPLYNGAESDLGMLGQKYGDNVAQLAAQLAVAGALDGESREQ